MTAPPPCHRRDTRFAAEDAEMQRGLERAPGAVTCVRGAQSRADGSWRSDFRAAVLFEEVLAAGPGTGISAWLTSLQIRECLVAVLVSRLPLGSWTRCSPREERARVCRTAVCPAPLLCAHGSGSSVALGGRLAEPAGQPGLPWAQPWLSWVGSAPPQRLSSDGAWRCRRAHGYLALKPRGTEAHVVGLESARGGQCRGLAVPSRWW